MKVSCARCGEVVDRKPSRVREANYCSRACHYASGAARPNRRTGQVKACETCNADFYAPAARPDARYCSQTCKGVGSRRTFTCETCGVESYGYQNVNKRWCSRACAFRARQNGETRSCAQCETSFYIPANRVAQDARFCSNACHNLWQGRHKTEHTCKMCGASFRWSPSRTAAGAKYTITYCSLACRDVDPARREMLLAMNVKLQLRRTTKTEAIGYALLDALGVDYERQSPFNGKFTPDAIVPSARLVVQFDGDYWHDRAGKSTEPRIRRRVSLDRSQDAYMRACGWEVLRLWDSDLRADPDGCTERIRQRLLRPV